MYYSRKPEVIKPIYQKWEKPFDSHQLDSRSFWGHLNAELGKNVSWEKLNAATFASYQALPGMLPLLRRLKSVVPLVLLSNTREEWFDFVDKKFDLSDYFVEKFLSFQLGCLKPDAKIFRLVSDRLKVAPEQLLFIDDKEENIRAAAKLGIAGIRFQGAAELERELKSYLFFKNRQ